MKLLLIGRSPKNDIVISDATVSGTHAQLIIGEGNIITLVDLNSTNGSFVNGQKIVGERILSQYDTVKLGESLFVWQKYIPQPQAPHIQEKPTPVQVNVQVQTPAPVAQHQASSIPYQPANTAHSQVHSTVKPKSRGGWYTAFILLLIPVLIYIGLSMSGRSLGSIMNLPKTIQLDVRCNRIEDLLVTTMVSVDVFNHSDRRHSGITIRLTGFDGAGNQIIEKVVSLLEPLDAQTSRVKPVTLPARTRSCKCEILNSSPQ